MLQTKQQSVVMNKSTNNKNKYNQRVITTLQNKYGVSREFIRLSIISERTSELAEKIKREYFSLNDKIEKLLSINSQTL